MRLTFEVNARAALRSFALAILLAGCSDEKKDDPKLEFTDIGFTLTLPPRMQQALDSVSPGLRLVRAFEYRSDVREAATEAGGGTAQALFAVIGDFDGDGNQDLVVEGTSPSDSALLVVGIMNTGAKAQGYMVARYPNYDASSVGIYLSKPVKPRPGAFEVVDYPDETTLYFFRGDKFEGMKVSG